MYTGTVDCMFVWFNVTFFYKPCCTCIMESTRNTWLFNHHATLSSKQHCYGSKGAGQRDTTTLSIFHVMFCWCRIDSFLMNLYYKAKHTTISHGCYAGAQFISATSLVYGKKYFWPMGDHLRQFPLYSYTC